jgi:hypothetical protein
MNIADPDVITWYRLVALHEQMKEEDDDIEKIIFLRKSKIIFFYSICDTSFNELVCIFFFFVLCIK